MLILCPHNPSKNEFKKVGLKKKDKEVGNNRKILRSRGIINKE